MHEPVGIRIKLDEELDHQHCKEDKTASTTDLRNELGKVVELELKRSAFGITSKSWESGSAAFGISFCKELTHHDTAIKTLRTDGDDNVLTNTLQDLRTGDNKRILLSLFIDLPVFESFWSNLLDRVRLASRTRLVTSDIVTSDQGMISPGSRRVRSPTRTSCENFNLQRSSRDEDID